jgi:amidase
MQMTLERIAHWNPQSNAIVSLQEPEILIAQARQRDAELARGQSRGWMHGLPQAIKDLANVQGLRTTLGSPLMKDFVASEDGLMAQRMKAAGAIVIGKTNTPELGLGSHTFNEVFGATRNAWDPGKTAGGSSGGAAVALAQRLLPVADGSDFMGSLRNPAGWNHVFGMRPSQGRVPLWPAQDAFIAQLATEGPMARHVCDLALLLSTQAGAHPNCPLSLSEDPAVFARSLDNDPQDQRIGWLGNLQGYLPMEGGILDVCQAALASFSRMGCHVEEATLGMAPEQIWQMWLVWRQALVGARVAPFLVNPANRALLKPEALWEYDQSLGLTGAQLMAASASRSRFYQSMLQSFEKFDVLAIPVAQVWPFEISLRWPQSIAGHAMDTYHRWMEVVIYATLAGLPSISVPAGFGANGLPMGLALIGKPQGDLALLKLAHAYEMANEAMVRQRPPGV